MSILAQSCGKRSICEIACLKRGIRKSHEIDTRYACESRDRLSNARRTHSQIKRTLECVRRAIKDRTDRVWSCTSQGGSQKRLISSANRRSLQLRSPRRRFEHLPHGEDVLDRERLIVEHEQVGVRVDRDAPFLLEFEHGRRVDRRELQRLVQRPAVPQHQPRESVVRHDRMTDIVGDQVPLVVEGRQRTAETARKMFANRSRRNDGVFAPVGVAADSDLAQLDALLVQRNQRINCLCLILCKSARALKATCTALRKQNLRLR